MSADRRSGVTWMSSVEWQACWAEGTVGRAYGVLRSIDGALENEEWIGGLAVESCFRPCE